MEDKDITKFLAILDKQTQDLLLSTDKLDNYFWLAATHFPLEPSNVLLLISQCSKAVRLIPIKKSDNKVYVTKKNQHPITLLEEIRTKDSSGVFASHIVKREYYDLSQLQDPDDSLYPEETYYPTARQTLKTVLSWIPDSQRTIDHSLNGVHYEDGVFVFGKVTEADLVQPLLYLYCRQIEQYDEQDALYVSLAISALYQLPCLRADMTLYLSLLLRCESERAVRSYLFQSHKLFVSLHKKIIIHL